MGNNTNTPEGPRPDDCAAWVAFAAAALGGSWKPGIGDRAAAAAHYAAEAAAVADALLGHYRETRRRIDARAEADARTATERRLGIANAPAAVQAGRAEALAALARFGAAIVNRYFRDASAGFDDASGSGLDELADRAGVAPYPDTFKLAPGVAEAADRVVGK